MSKVNSQVAIMVILLVLESILSADAEGVNGAGVNRKQNFNVVNGKTLTGHVVETHHVTDPINCIFACLECKDCRSMNYKSRASAEEKDVCELNNATRRNNSESFKDDLNSNYYYNMEPEVSRSCLDYLRNGATENGIYTITDVSGDSYQVWCDLTSEPRSAWTLFMSYAFKNKDQDAFCKSSFTEDAQVNQEEPNMEAYRLSKQRMQLLAKQSTHFRVTSGSKKYGVDFRDYLRVKLSDFDIMNFLGSGECKNVEYINIRGTSAMSTTVPFWQLTFSNPLHVDSSERLCRFNAVEGSVGSENNFGLLCVHTNSAFRASETPESTNENWFGGYL